VSRAIASLGFAARGTEIGTDGSAERDGTVRALSPGELADELTWAARGRRVTAIAQTVADGPVSTGTLMRVGDVAELSGIATLPSARRRGLGAAVAAALARRGLAIGADLVFLTAGGTTLPVCIVEPVFGGSVLAASPRPTHSDREATRDAEWRDVFWRARFETQTRLGFRSGGRACLEPNSTWVNRGGTLIRARGGSWSSSQTLRSTTVVRTLSTLIVRLLRAAGNSSMWIRSTY
jgi:hypothetical protein